MRPINVESKAIDFRDELYKLDKSYTIGTNDGTEFNNVVFTGTKLYHGKPMLTFKIYGNLELNINQSYLSYAIEEPIQEDSNG